MSSNKMFQLELDKVVLHCSTADQQKLERYMNLLKLISGKKPIKTKARKRIPTFKVRPGLPIGCKVTLRKADAARVLKTVLTGITELEEDNFGEGYLNFGIKEYIEIQAIEFRRDIGILGFDVTAVLARKGFKIDERKRKRSKIGNKHKISQEETIEFFKQNFEVKLK
ncbi:MAG: 50S ribosomal protein L5 [archaeon]|nr:MAG: 50S ribosomal protein L5 [archaeon]